MYTLPVPQSTDDTLSLKFIFMTKMHAKLTSLNHCAVPFLSRADNLGWCYYLTFAGPKRFARISKTMTHQTRNVYPCSFVC